LDWSSIPPLPFPWLSLAPAQTSPMVPELELNDQQSRSKQTVSGAPPFHPTQTVSLFLHFFRRFNCLVPQLPDRVVTDLRFDFDRDVDAESPRIATSTTSRDPYNFGHGLKSDAEIAELRSRKRGKRLANFHQRQNDVGVSESCLFISFGSLSMACIHSSSLLS